MIIKEAIIHHLAKEQHTFGEGTVQLQERDSLLPIDATLEKVCNQTLKLFQKNANNTGTFGEDEDVHRFPVRLREYLAGTVTFTELCSITCRIIKDEMQESSAANGGHAFFLHYGEGGQDFLLVAMLKLREGAGISENLELLATVVIDTDKLHEAARINLTRWDAAEEPYLTFIKGRGRDAVTGYFRDALACVGYTSSKHHTEEVLRAAQAFVNASPGLNAEQKSEKWAGVRTKLFECFQANSEEVLLEAIALAVEPTAPEQFVEFVTTGESAGQFAISHQFKPDKATFRKLRVIKGKMGTVAVSFEVSDIMAGRVMYDEQADALVLMRPTEEIKREVRDYGRAAE